MEKLIIALGVGILIGRATKDSGPSKEQLEAIKRASELNRPMVQPRPQIMPAPGVRPKPVVARPKPMTVTRPATVRPATRPTPLINRIFHNTLVR